MRHQNSGRRFNMAPDQRKALLTGLACQLLEHEKVKTGVARAKEVRPLVEEAITLGKRGDLHARRQAISLLRNKKIVYKLFNDVAPRYADRHGGYTRIMKIGQRPGDAAPMSILELLPDENAAAEKESKPASKTAKEGKGKKEPTEGKAKDAGEA